MKKLTVLVLCLLFMNALTLSAMAAEEAVAFSSDSSFVAGGTVKVDDMKTRHNIMDLGADAAQYNAALEGNLQYYWFRDDQYCADGPSITLTEADKGCQFYCRVYLFEDADRTLQCGMYDSARFTVPNPDQQTTQPTTAPTLPSTPTTNPTLASTVTPTTQPTTQTTPTTQPDVATQNTAAHGFPWWGIVLIIAGAMAAGASMAVIVTRKKK